MELYHYGTPRHSGRYPWGSGENPYQHNADFLAQVKALKNEGLSEKERAQALGMSIQQLRNEISIANTAKKAADYSRAYALSESGKGPSEIGRIMGLSESTVRSMLNPARKHKEDLTSATVSVLRKNVSEKKYIDIGSGVASSMGITDTRLKAAVQVLKNEGYTIHYDSVEQLGNPGNFTSLKILAAPGVTYSEVHKNIDKIGVVGEKFVNKDDVRIYGAIKPPKNISSRRIEVVGAERGGASKDGVIELRRGVDGLDLGNSRYAQVRIAVDGTHYLKGMAIYSDDLPDGIDIRVNSNKSESLSKKDHFKKFEDDPENPFKASIKEGGQRGYLNIVNEEGDWSEWSRTLSSQFLGKQPRKLAAQQLQIARQDREREFRDIQALTNPTLKKHMLLQFADECDAAAVHLKAAAMPRQANKIILPVNSLKPNEVYAPGYENGETVILVRHPHGGTFEIPTLKVNNRNKEARSIFPNARDAIGIHPDVAQRLSGADFDGDTVLIIPNNRKQIRTTPAIKSLQEFDPKAAYPGYEGMRHLKGDAKQIEMGKVSNLITDMTLQGAPQEDIIRAVKHSMVVIDAEKHKLNWQQSEKDFGIDALKRKYQKKEEPGKYGGAATLLSRAKSELRVDERRRRKPDYKIDPDTGEKLWIPSGREPYLDKKGKLQQPFTKTTKMAEAKDARDLISVRHTAIEELYADHANKMKALGNQARKEYLRVEEPKADPAAKKKYAAQVASLDAQLTRALANTPLERKAQAIANVEIAAKKQSISMTRDELKKEKARSLAKARARIGAKRSKIDISDKEWEAIQAGAVSKTKQAAIFRFADQDQLKERALPKSRKTMTAAKINTAKARLEMGYTLDEVAKALGVSVGQLEAAIY